MDQEGDSELILCFGRFVFCWAHAFLQITLDPQICLEIWRTAKTGINLSLISRHGKILCPHRKMGFFYPQLKKQHPGLIESCTASFSVLQQSPHEWLLTKKVYDVLLITLSARKPEGWIACSSRAREHKERGLYSQKRQTYSPWGTSLVGWPLCGHVAKWGLTGLWLYFLQGF